MKTEHQRLNPFVTSHMRPQQKAPVTSDSSVPLKSAQGSGGRQRTNANDSTMLISESVLPSRASHPWVRPQTVKNARRLAHMAPRSSYGASVLVLESVNPESICAVADSWRNIPITLRRKSWITHLESVGARVGLSFHGWATGPCKLNIP